MARTLSTNLAAKAAQQYGSEPIIVVKIAWPSGVRYYTDKNYTFGANVCEPKILSLGNIVSQTRQESSASVSSANISIDDTDNTIKSSVNRDLLAGTVCTIYQTYSGLSQADALIVLQGRIANDIAWSEGQRTLSCTIDTAFNVGELGYAPKKGDLAGLSNEAEGKMWPIVFGSCLKVPAVQIYKEVTGSYPNDNFTSWLAGSTFYVVNGENFPQGTSCKIRTKNGTALQGTFTGNLFTVTENNVALDTAVAVGARVADEDEHNPYVCWLTGDQYLLGKLCYIATGPMVNRCIRQIGKKCWFAKPWKITGNNTVNELASTAIDETSHFKRDTWPNFVYEVLSGSVWVPSNYYSTWTTKYKHDIALVTGLVPTYIVNSAPSTIKGVYAYRTYNGKKTLDPVPSSYYTKYNSTVINGKTVTALTFATQLSDKLDQGWEDEIYVTLTSSLSANTADVIEYLLETFTDYTADAASFLAVKNTITNCPSHFALTDQSDTISLVADIAYQARVAVTYDSNIAKLKYLAVAPTSIFTLNDDQIRAKTLDYSFTSLEDVVTKYTALWRASSIALEQKYVYTGNTNIYGIKEEEKEYFIYNIESLVKLSADFWANRLSNSWRTLKLSTFLSALALETFDCITVATPTLLVAGIRGDVKSVSLDTLEDVIAVEAVLASKSGVHSSGNPVEDLSYYGTGTLPATMPADPTNGVQEVDYTPLVDVEQKTASKTKITLSFTSLPEKIVRGQLFAIEAKAYNDDGTLRLLNKTFDLTVNETTEVDVVVPSSIVFVNGVASNTFTLYDGTTDVLAVFNILGLEEDNTVYSTALSDGIPVTSEPTLIWNIDHTANSRESTFNVIFSNGLPSTTYTVTINSQDPNEKLYDGTTEVTSFVTNATGDYNAVWNFRDGTFALNSVIITATHDGHDYPSPELLVIESGGSSALVVEATITGAYAGDVVMNSGAAWVLADPNDVNIGTKTLGVVGLVKTGDVCLIVCRGLICNPGLTPHTDYNLVDVGIAGSGVGKFVMRSYDNDLCWVGGGTTIAKFTDIGDVDDSVTLADGMIAIYNGTLWVPAALDGAVFLVCTSPDDSLAITHPGTTVDFTINKVLVSKIEAIASNSIIANVTASLAAPTAVTAVTDGHVLRLSGTTLGFGTIGDASITSLAWSKLTGVPPLASATHTHTLSGDVTGTVTGAVSIANGAVTEGKIYTGAVTEGKIGVGAVTEDKIAASAVTTNKILNANVTNAKLANPSMTINGIVRTLGDSFNITGTFTNPMTTAGDMIVGGTDGALTRLAVNAGGTLQILASKSGITQYVTATLDMLEDVDLTVPPTNGQTLVYNGTAEQWVPGTVSGGGSTTVMSLCKVTAQHATLTNTVTIEVYPHGRTTEGGDVTWSGVTALVPQISSFGNKIPVDTWLIAIGTLKVPAPSPLANDATDYNWYVQPPIWM